MLLFSQSWTVSIIIVGGLPVLYSAYNWDPLCWAANISFSSAGLQFAFDFNVLPFLVEHFTDHCLGYSDGRSPGAPPREALRDTVETRVSDEDDAFDASRLWSESALEAHGFSDRGAPRNSATVANSTTFDDPAVGRGSQDGLGLENSEEWHSVMKSTSNRLSTEWGNPSSSTFSTSDSEASTRGGRAEQGSDVRASVLAAVQEEWPLGLDIVGLLTSEALESPLLGTQDL